MKAESAGSLGYPFGRSRFEERCVHVLHQRHIERIEPDDSRLAVMLVFVPSPGGREDEVAPLHLAALAVDDRGGAATFDNEAQRVH